MNGLYHEKWRLRFQYCSLGIGPCCRVIKVVDLLLYLVDPVRHCDHLVCEEGAGVFFLFCFFPLVCNICTVCRLLFPLSLGAIW